MKTKPFPPFRPPELLQYRIYYVFWCSLSSSDPVARPSRQEPKMIFVHSPFFKGFSRAPPPPLFTVRCGHFSRFKGTAWSLRFGRSSPLIVYPPPNPRTRQLSLASLSSAFSLLDYSETRSRAALCAASSQSLGFRRRFSFPDLSPRKTFRFLLPSIFRTVNIPAKDVWLTRRGP